MKTCRVRRIPVVEAGGQLVGIISHADLARFAEPNRGRRATIQTAVLAAGGIGLGVALMYLLDPMLGRFRRHKLLYHAERKIAPKTAGRGAAEHRAVTWKPLLKLLGTVALGLFAHSSAAGRKPAPSSSRKEAHGKPSGGLDVRRSRRRAREVNMMRSLHSRVAGSLVLLGSILVYALSPARGEEASRSETTKLIASLQGPALYNAYCAVCHGKDGKGGGPLAKSLKVKPPDLTGIAERNHGSFPRDRVQKILASDELLPAGHGSREMPVWGPVFSRVVWDRDLGPVRVYNLTKHLEKMQAK
jgi:mono/diheme cytochrome c family protein